MLYDFDDILSYLESLNILTLPTVLCQKIIKM